MSRTLIDIDSDLQDLLSLLEDAEGESDLQDDLLDTWFARLESLKAERNDKLDAYAALIKENRARSDIRKAEAERLRRLARADESLAERLERRLGQFFLNHGIEKVNTSRFRLQLTTNGGHPPVVLDPDVDLADVPIEYVRVRREIDKDAIRGALLEGADLSFARLGERERSLRIR